ncbi:MAG: Circadian clock protein KaiB [Marmoricola sp.]|nr:Circadian clock protein KaiB [Marmoricola sp.]
MPPTTPAATPSTTAVAPAPDETQVPLALTLFVSGAAPRSTAAVAVVRAVCDSDLGTGVRLSVQDAAADPTAARTHDVVVLPTLVATGPGPRRHLVLDRTDLAQVRAWITDLLPAASGPPGPEGVRP